MIQMVKCLTPEWVKDPKVPSLKCFQTIFELCFVKASHHFIRMNVTKYIVRNFEFMIVKQGHDIQNLFWSFYIGLAVFQENEKFVKRLQRKVLTESPTLLLSVAASYCMSAYRNVHPEASYRISSKSSPGIYSKKLAVDPAFIRDRGL